MADHYTIRGGIDSTAVYKEEVVYATNPGTWTANAAHFGLTQSVTPTLSRNLARLRGLSGLLPADNETATSRDAFQIVAGKSELTVNVVYQPQEFSFLKYVVGSVSGATTFEYPQATAVSEADKRKYVKIPSFTVAERFDFEGTGDAANTVLLFTGLKVNSWEMRGAIGEPVECTANLMGSNVAIDQTGIATNYPYTALSAEDVFHFIDSDIKVGATSYPNLIDGFSLTVSNTTQGLGDMRSYVNEAVIAMGRDWTITVDANFENITQLKNMLGGESGLEKPTKIDSMSIVLDKGDNKNLTVILYNLRTSEPIAPTTYGEVMKESITLEAEFGKFIENDV